MKYPIKSTVPSCHIVKAWDLSSKHLHVPNTCSAFHIFLQQGPICQSLVRASAVSMQCLLLLPALFVLSMPAPSGHIWWNVEDWADDLSYNLTHMNAGGPLGFGILGTTPPPRPGLLEGLLGLIFPTTTTTTAPTTTKCSGVIGLGLAC